MMLTEEQLENAPEKLWAAWFRPRSQYSKPKRVTLDEGSWWHKNGMDEVQQPGLHLWEGYDGAGLPGLVVFASEDKAEVAQYIYFSALLIDAVKHRINL